MRYVKASRKSSLAHRRPYMRGRAYDHCLPFDTTIRLRILPRMEGLMAQLRREGEAMAIDDQKVFSGDEPFLPGSIASMYAWLLIHKPKSDPDHKSFLKGFADIARLTLDQRNDTWGRLFYLRGLYWLQEAGLLNKAVPAKLRVALRDRLDWRSFVDVETFNLKNAPANYYGVAFGIAMFRVKLGWDAPEIADAFLARLTAHYASSSGAFGFSDEAPDQGRYDRYSFLLPSEIAHHFHNVGEEVPEIVKGWMRKALPLFLMRMNLRGEGLEYGRSIGPYGDSAMVEALTMAATCGLLDKEQARAAYSFCSRVAARYSDFWWDEAMGSVNMWKHGRSTDDYRGKFRIFGENLSLTTQYLLANEMWNKLGCKGRSANARFSTYLDHLPKRQLTWFAKEGHERALLTLRDRDRLIGLPLVNGGRRYYHRSDYLPVPYSPGLLAGAPLFGFFPQLTPKFTLGDGSVLMPLAFFKGITLSEDGDTLVLDYRLDTLAAIGGPEPVADPRLGVTTTYRFSAGHISRSDTYTATEPLDIQSLEMQFASFSFIDEITDQTVTYVDGEVRHFSATGFETCVKRRTDKEKKYRTPTGPYRGTVTYSRGPFVMSSTLILTWDLSYT